MYSEEMINIRNEKRAAALIGMLEKRKMTGYYAESKEKALEIALSLIPAKSTVAMGGSMSVNAIGLVDAMKNGDYNFIDRDSYPPEKKREAALKAYEADVFLGSCNAISEDGILVNIDGISNRVSAYAFGPEKLVLVVGMNKIAPDLDSALKRARNEAAPINAQRFNLNTPCSKTGKCMDCLSPDTICCNFLITRVSRLKDRIHIILVNEDLGY